ncbi:hypothetical protein KIN20_020154 [Parelaphostrongylus tenuis]|uniref:Uncharacterized protein n=1 Tax=Parelaphostrongylus tenuis TaxID=148309 RepID=A0AAD5N2Y6_PARTN|nr:hypothetical protein KIN20_020154 [Parelaphostrongylus tenuis]
MELCSMLDQRRGTSTTDSERHSPDNEPNKDERSEESPPNDQNPEKPKVDPALLKKLRIYVLIIGGLSFVMSFIILSQMPAGQPDMEDVEKYLTKPGIDVETFFSKYLKSGEVRRIVFCPNHSRAVAFLYEGAVIDGKKVHDPVVVISYPQGPQQFWADVRKEESIIGISLADGVRIDLYKGFSTLRMIEFMVGVLILAWLGTQYGRLLRQRWLSRKKE